MLHDQVVAGLEVLQLGRHAPDGVEELLLADLHGELGLALVLLVTLHHLEQLELAAGRKERASGGAGVGIGAGESGIEYETECQESDEVGKELEEQNEQKEQNKQKSRRRRRRWRRTCIALALASSRAVTHFCLSTSEEALD